MTADVKIFGPHAEGKKQMKEMLRHSLSVWCTIGCLTTEDASDLLEELQSEINQQWD